MRSRILIALFAFCLLAQLAGAQIKPLDVKLGLWEVTSTSLMTGLPGIPPDVLAKLPADQRAKMEAAMGARAGGAPKTTAQKVCITREKLDKENAFGEDRKNCTRTVVTSSASKLEMKVQCTEEHNMTMNGTIHVEALNSETVKGSVRMTSGTGNGQTMNVNSDFTSRYLGPACGDVK
jgi:hypothetical protein